MIQDTTVPTLFNVTKKGVSPLTSAPAAPAAPDVPPVLDLSNPIIAAIVRRSNIPRDLAGRWEFTIDIDTRLASSLLANLDDKQRRLAKTRMTHIKRDIDNGRWENTGDPIRVSLDGTLIDGQHRLTAFCSSDNMNVLKDMTVVILKTKSALDVVDIGKPRSVNDIRRMTGRQYLPSRAIGGILFEARDFDAKGAALSKIERNEVVDACTYLEKAHALASDRAPTPVVAAAIRCMKVDEELAYKFFLAAVTNEHNLDGVHIPAIKVLSTWLMTNTHSGGGHAIRREMVVRCINAWNAYRSNNKSIKFLRYNARGKIPTAK